MTYDRMTESENNTFVHEKGSTKFVPKQKPSLLRGQSQNEVIDKNF